MCVDAAVDTVTFNSLRRAGLSEWTAVPAAARNTRSTIDQHRPRRRAARRITYSVRLDYERRLPCRHGINEPTVIVRFDDRNERAIIMHFTVSISRVYVDLYSAL